MKRMNYLLAGLIIPAMLASCSSEDGVAETPIAPSDKDLPIVKLYANNGGSGTRTTIDNFTGVVNWSQSDKINVNGNASTNIRLNGAYAIFEVAAVGPYAAIYPASIHRAFNADGTFSVIVPSEQKYNGESFADDVNISVAHSETEQLSFKNVCGLLKATIKADAGVTLDKIKKVRFNADMPISGQATLNPKTMGIAFESSNTKNYIDVVFDTPQTITGAQEIKVVWSLPPRTYNNWSIELYNEDGNVLKTISTIVSPVAVKRSAISTVQNAQVYPQYYTVEIKNDNAVTDKSGLQWMRKGEKLTVTVSKVAKPGYSFHKWITNAGTMKHTVNNNIITVTAYTNEVISAEVVEGLIVPIRNTTSGVIIEGKNILFSRTPLRANGEFLSTYVEMTEWTTLPIVSTITTCPTGWRLPNSDENYFASKLLVDVMNYYIKEGLFTFNWYPTYYAPHRVYNVSPSVAITVMNPNNPGLLPRPEATSHYVMQPEMLSARLPIRCVKDLTN